MYGVRLPQRHTEETDAMHGVPTVLSQRFTGLFEGDGLFLLLLICISISSS